MRKDLVPPLATASTAAAPSALRRPGRAVARCAALLLVSGAAAAQVLIDPVVVELGAQQRSASVTVALSDKAPAPMRLQAQVLRWTQDAQGAAVTQPSSDLLVTPPIAELRPGQKQLFRIAQRGARATPGELAYRLVLEDVAPIQARAANPQGMSINFRMRYDLPVMLAPAGPVRNLLRWKPCPAASAAKAGEACVRIVNGGNRRVKVQSLTLAGDGWQQVLALTEGVNVLAGAEREWRVRLQAGDAGPLRGVQVRTAHGESLQAAPGDE